MKGRKKKVDLDATGVINSLGFTTENRNIAIREICVANPFFNVKKHLPAEITAFSQFITTCGILPHMNILLWSPTAEQRPAIPHIMEKYIIIDGAKRIAAATEAGLHEMAAVIVTCPGSHRVIASKVQQLCAICSTANDFVSNWRFSERSSFFCTFLTDIANVSPKTLADGHKRLLDTVGDIVTLEQYRKYVNLWLVHLPPETKNDIQKLEMFAPINTTIFSTDFILRTFTNINEDKTKQLATIVRSFVEAMEMARSTRTSVITEVFLNRLTSFRDQVEAIFHGSQIRRTAGSFGKRKRSTESNETKSSGEVEHEAKRPKIPIVSPSTPSTTPLPLLSSSLLTLLPLPLQSLSEAPPSPSGLPPSPSESSPSESSPSESLPSESLPSESSPSESLPSESPLALLPSLAALTTDESASQEPICQQLGSNCDLATPYNSWSQLDYKADSSALQRIWRENNAVFGDDYDLFFDVVFPILHTITFWNREITKAIFAPSLNPGKYIVFVNLLQSPEVDVLAVKSWISNETPLIVLTYIAENQVSLCDPFNIATNQVSLQAFNIRITDHVDLKDFFQATSRKTLYHDLALFLSVIMRRLSISRFVNLSSGEHVKLALEMSLRNHVVDLPNASETAVANFCTNLWLRHFRMSSPKPTPSTQMLDDADAGDSLFFWLMWTVHILVFDIAKDKENNAKTLDRLRITFTPSSNKTECAMCSIERIRKCLPFEIIDTWLPSSARFTSNLLISLKESTQQFWRLSIMPRDMFLFPADNYYLLRVILNLSMTNFTYVVQSDKPLNPKDFEGKSLQQIQQNHFVRIIQVGNIFTVNSWVHTLIINGGLSKQLFLLWDSLPTSNLFMFGNMWMNEHKPGWPYSFKDVYYSNQITIDTLKFDKTVCNRAVYGTALRDHWSIINVLRQN